MSAHPRSEAHAREIVEDVAIRAEQLFGPNLQGVFVIGSLAHGGFSPESSDIDLALILKQVDSGTALTVAELREDATAHVHTPLSKRVSIFWSDTAHLRHGQGRHMRLGAVDRADLLLSGVCVRGKELSDRSTLPTRDELVTEGANFAAEKLDARHLSQSAETLVAGGARAASKYVLFPVRLLYTLHTGEIGLNAASAAWYVARGGTSAALVELALVWRDHGFHDEQQAIHAISVAGDSLYRELFAELAVEGALSVEQRRYFHARCIAEEGR